MWITDNSDERVFEYGTAYTPEQRRRVDPSHADQPHFNGYGINPESASTVAELVAYYVEGRPHQLTGLTATAEAMERGHPVCADMTTRWRSWRGPEGHWPRYDEAGTPYPGPRPPEAAPGPAPGAGRTAPGRVRRSAAFLTPSIALAYSVRYTRGDEAGETKPLPSRAGPPPGSTHRREPR